MRLGPNLRLVLRDPIDLGLGAKVIHRTLQPGQLEQPAPRPLDRLTHFGLALIQPEHRWAQRLTLFVDIDHAAALGGQRHTLDQAPVDIHLLPELRTGLAQAGPVILRVLLSPARLSGVIRFKLDFALGEQIALQIEQQRANALGAVVDGQ